MLHISNVRHHRQAGFADFAKVSLTPTYAQTQGRPPLRVRVSGIVI